MGILGDIGGAIEGVPGVGPLVSAGASLLGGGKGVAGRTTAVMIDGERVSLHPERTAKHDDNESPRRCPTTD